MYRRDVSFQRKHDSYFYALMDSFLVQIKIFRAIYTLLSLANWSLIPRQRNLHFSSTRLDEGSLQNLLARCWLCYFPPSALPCSLQSQLPNANLKSIKVFRNIGGAEHVAIFRVRCLLPLSCYELQHPSFWINAEVVELEGSQLTIVQSYGYR